jgi:hypothetical protein
MWTTLYFFCDVKMNDISLDGLAAKLEGGSFAEFVDGIRKCSAFGELFFDPSLKNHVEGKNVTNVSEDDYISNPANGLLDSEKEIYYTHVLRLWSKRGVIVPVYHYTDDDFKYNSFSGTMSGKKYGIQNSTIDGDKNVCPTSMIPDLQLIQRLTREDTLAFIN